LDLSQSCRNIDGLVCKLGVVGGSGSEGNRMLSALGFDSRKYMVLAIIQNAIPQSYTETTRSFTKKTQLHFVVPAHRSVPAHRCELLFKGLLLSDFPACRQTSVCPLCNGFKRLGSNGLIKKGATNYVTPFRSGSYDRYSSNITFLITLILFVRTLTKYKPDLRS
jgi:hypothetical protein